MLSLLKFITSMCILLGLGHFVGTLLVKPPNEVVNVLNYHWSFGETAFFSLTGSFILIFGSLFSYIYLSLVALAIDRIFKTNVSTVFSYWWLD